MSHDHQSSFSQSSFSQSSFSQSSFSPGECAGYLQQIIYFLDNELDEADCADVRRHLDECGPCLHHYDLERTVKSVVARSCSESAPESLRQRVTLQIREVQIRITEV